MRSGFVALLVALIGSGCHTTKSVAEAADSVNAPAKEGPGASVDGMAGARGHDDAPPEPVSSAEDKGTWPADISVVIQSPDGSALRIAAALEESSILWAEPLSKAGTPSGPAAKLAETSGEVATIAADVSGDLLWVAWRSTLELGERQIVALAGFDASLAVVHKPQTLRTIGHPPVGDQNLLVEGRGGDGRVAVAALIGTRPCKAMHPDERGSCRGMQIDLVAAGGTIERSEQRWLDGGDGAVDGLIDAGTGIVASFHVWHGGPLMDVAFVPYDPAKSVRSFPDCDYPPVRPLVVDRSVVLLCPDPDAPNSGSANATVGCNVSAERETCGRMARVDFRGKRLTPWAKRSPPVPLRSLSKRCKGSSGFVRLAWEGGALDVPADAFGIRCED